MWPIVEKAVVGSRAAQDRDRSGGSIPMHPLGGSTEPRSDRGPVERPIVTASGGASGNSRTDERDTERWVELASEEAFQERCQRELSQDRPPQERAKDARVLCGFIQYYSSNTLETIWQVAGDMTASTALLEVRKAGFDLLRASASHPDSQAIRVDLFNMITTPAPHSLVGLQISALNRLTREGRDLSPIEREVVSFLNTLLDELFPAVEQAREEQRGIEAGAGASTEASPPRALSSERLAGKRDSSKDQKGAPKERPQKEKAFLDTFYLIADVIAKNPKAFHDAQMQTMLETVTQIATKTRGRALLRGAIKIISGVATHSKIQDENLKSCVHVLCTVIGIPNIKFADEAWAGLTVLLRSDDWEGVLSMLNTTNLMDSAKPEAIRCSVLDGFNHVFLTLRDDTNNIETYCRHLRSACQYLQDEKDVPASMIDSLADLTAQCGAEVDLETFHALLDTLEKASRLSSTDSATSAALSDRIPDCLIRLFLQCLLHSGPKTAKLYAMLLNAAAPQKPTNIRLSVLKLLARLRCDSSYGIKIVSMPDSQDLASTLSRTKAAEEMRDSSQWSNRFSASEKSQSVRAGRSSGTDSSRETRSRSATRSASLRDRPVKISPPLWIYDGLIKGLPMDPPSGSSKFVYAENSTTKSTKSHLDFGRCLQLMINELQDCSNWEAYSYVLVHLPSQLSNCSLFEDRVMQLQRLHDLLNSHLAGNSFHTPPASTGLKRGDVALCLYHSLTTLLAYQSHFGVRELSRTVNTFRAGIEKWDRVNKYCIQALSLCCYELPNNVDKQIPAILDLMQRRIYQPDLAMDILEFLGGLAHLRDAYSTADVTTYKTIFGICVRYLQYAREQRRNTTSESARASMQYNRGSGNSGELARSYQSQSPQMIETQKDIAEYVYILAYHVIIFWFMAIDVRERCKHVGWIAQELAWKDESGVQRMEEQSLVILDLMHRTTYSDFGETVPKAEFVNPEKKVYKGTWLLGMSIVTAEIILDDVSGRIEIGQVTKRQASGTTHAVYYHNAALLPSHHVQTSNNTSWSSAQDPVEIYPNHLLLQLISTISPVPIPMQPIPLPDDEEFANRAIRLFDATDTVDGHKVGIIYISKDQKSENEILANDRGSNAYEGFLSKIGVKVPLKGAKFNSQGLDRQYGKDGDYTYAWRDRIMEIVFHVSTMMPNDLENDPLNDKKKAHIGNDHVRIIFNESGLPFDFDTFVSEFNSVNIVITPEADISHSNRITDRTLHQEPESEIKEKSLTERFGYYVVHTLTSPQYPDISPATSPKVLSACALPAFVRQIALNASVFCQVWQHRGEGEHVSSWRYRLQQIIKLRAKYANTNRSANERYPLANPDTSTANHTYAEGDTWTGTLAYGGIAETNQLLAGLDFTRWAI